MDIENPPGIGMTTGSAVNLAYRATGQPTAPPVLFLHGTSANLTVWDDVIDAMCEPAYRIAIDQRGHGRSDKPAAGYAADDYGADIAAVCDAFRLGPVFLVGHSLGARNAWVFAARNPRRVAAVLAVDYVPFVTPDVLNALEKRVAAGEREFASTVDIARYLRQRYPGMTERAIERRTKFGYHASNGSYRPLASSTALRHTVDGLRTDYPTEFAQVAESLTAIRGAHSAIVSRTAWTTARALAPSARWVEVDGADHYVPEERPLLVAGELDRLLSETRPQQGS